MNKYPYIGKAPINDSPSQKSFDTCLFFHEGFGVALDSNVNHGEGYISSEWCEQGVFKNITREYLEGKCVKLIGDKDRFFIIDLCQANDIEVANQARSFEWAMFYQGAVFFCDNKISDNFEEITIPLPPKKELKLPVAPKHIDCMCIKCGGKCCLGLCNKPKVDEWPKVGDEVIINGRLGEVISNKDLAGKYPVMVEDCRYVLAERYEIMKPKTEAEKLTAEIETMIHNQLTANNFTGDLALGDIASIICSELEVNFKVSKL